jgi:hypothetical protein
LGRLLASKTLFVQKGLISLLMSFVLNLLFGKSASSPVAVENPLSVDAADDLPKLISFSAKAMQAAPVQAAGGGFLFCFVVSSLSNDFLFDSISCRAEKLRSTAENCADGRFWGWEKLSAETIYCRLFLAKLLLDNRLRFCCEVRILA